VSHDIVPLPVVRIAAVEAVPVAHRWLVHDLWADEAVGVVGGSPKSFKSWLALEIALAVASGRPALGRFAVRPGGSGPVLVYAAEDSAAAVRERVAGLAKARGIAFDKLAMGLITIDSLRLDRPDHRDRLRATLEKIRPRLLVLDPLVRLHRADENSSSEISELLGWLRGWQREFHVAILLVHHVRKSPTGQPGQSLRGSGDLHAWGDSNLYLLRDRGRLILHAEHRSNPVPQPFAIELSGDPPRLIAKPIEGTGPDQALIERVLQTLARQPLTRTELRERLHVRNETLGAVLDHLEADGQILRADGRLAVPVLRDPPERNDPTA
jgi:hypothetical protein